MNKLFGTSGIRGLYGSYVTPELAIKVGKALGTYISKKEAVIGMDTRTSSLLLENSVVAGLESTGCNVIRAGMIPTPALAFAARKLNSVGVMITASHNPAEYNGIKVWNNDGSAFRLQQEEELEKIISEENFENANWDLIKKSVSDDFSEDYLQLILNSVEIGRRFKISLDCGNGACSIISPLALEEFALQLKTIFTETNGIFPRGLEPSKENLLKLGHLVQKTKSDLGIAHDGDGDRVALMDEKGNFAGRDQLLALLMKNELEGTSGHEVAVPIDTSKIIEHVAADYSAKVIYTKIGDVAVAEELKARSGIFGGEPSGCFIFPKIGLWPDGILSALKILEFISAQEKKVSELLNELPKYHTIREVIKCKPNEKNKIYEKIAKKIENIGNAHITRIDGIRADFENSWVLARQSGTEPKVRITIEAKNKKESQILRKKIL